MKIDPVTYEVDVTQGTKPIYVWEAPIRVWHWAMAACMFVMIVTGFLIGSPMLSNYGPTWMIYNFGYIRLAHFVAAFIFTGLFIYRIYWAFVGNRYAYQIFLPPLWSLKWWKGVVAQAMYYLFLRKSAPEYVGHNPLAQLAMFAMYVIGSIVIIITGFALYAQAWGWGLPWMDCFGWVFSLFGSVQAVRTTHHVCMYVLILFSMAHMYMSFREDIMGGTTVLSSMTSGLRMFKEDHSKHH